MASRWENLGTIIVVLAAIIPFIFQTTQQENILSLIIFGAMLLVVIAYFIADYVKDKLGQIDKALERVGKLEEKVDYMKQIRELDKRVTTIEKKQKGQIDPRIVIIVILLVLLALYLRSISII